jgi:MFS family permease
VLSLGAATLADIFEPHERGTKVGIYYMAPMLGPAIGPILGGVLTQGFNWRGPFWFLAIFGGLNLCSFLFLFKDTFRKQRSLTYQLALQRHMRENELHRAKHASQETVTSTAVGHTSDDEKDSEKIKPAPVSNGDIESQIFKRKARPAVAEVKVSLKDVNPLGPLWEILRRTNNVVILISSGTYFFLASIWT